MDQLIIRTAADETIRSLGGPVSKTIIRYMSSKGILAETTRIDIREFYSTLSELVGPGADMIMEEMWKKVKNRYHGHKLPESGTTVERIIQLTSADGGVK